MPANPPSSCIVLVPVAHRIEPACEDALRELEQLGYLVRRLHGCPAIDVARNRMASDALREGFEDLLWIDSDIVFHPDDVERLRSHTLPFVCGLYPKKDRKGFACRFLPGTGKVTMGERGGLVEVLYAAVGFAMTRRPVYEAIRDRLGLPECDVRPGPGLVPYFLPAVVESAPGVFSYLPEDYAFCERARRSGVAVMADTAVRLWHVGSYAFTWEDLGKEVAG
jgi:hypothetical protein